MFESSRDGGHHPRLSNVSLPQFVGGCIFGIRTKDQTPATFMIPETRSASLARDTQYTG